MKNFVLVFLLLALIVILIVVSQPVKNLVDIDDKFISNSELNRHPRHLKPKFGICKINQYFDKAVGRCLGVIGGGRVLYINNTKSCGANLLKPHCTNPKYYYICKQNRTILAECPNNRFFESKLQKCVLVPHESYISDAAQSNLDTFKRFLECKKPGSFSVPGECSLFYTCARNGYQMSQDFYRCPRNMAYDAEIEMCSPSSSCQDPRASPSLCSLNSSSFVVPNAGIVCETMYTNGEVIAAANIDEAAINTAVNVDETITSREQVTRAMLNDNETAFTTVSYVETSASRDNDVANKMAHTQDMSRSSDVDGSTSTALHSTSTFEKKTNSPMEPVDNITAMKEISKQDVKDDIVNATPSILPDLLTSSVTEKGVEASTVVVEANSVGAAEKEMETSTVFAEINSVGSTEKEVDMSTVVVEASTVVVEANLVGNTQKEVETSTVFPEINSVGTTEKEINASTVVVETISVGSTEKEVETSTIAVKADSVGATEKEIETSTVVVEANSVGSTEKEVEMSTVVVEASTVVVEANLVGSTEKEVETSTVFTEINSVGTTEKEINASTVVVEANSVGSTEKKLETSTVVVEANSVGTTEKEVETSTVFPEINSVGTTEKEINASTVVVETISVGSTEKEVETSTIAVKADSVGATEKEIETSTVVVEANSVGSTEKEVEMSTVVVEASTVVVEANLVGSTEKEVETSTVFTEINSVGTTEKEINASTVVVEANSVGSTEKKLETSTVVVEANSVGTTEKEVETSTVVEVETSTVVVEANSVGFTEKKVETSTVIAQINSIGTTEKEIQASTVVVEANSIATTEKEVETSTVVAQINSIGTTEREIQASTVVAETNSIGTTESKIQASTVVAETNVVGSTEKEVETSTVFAEINSVGTTEKEVQASTVVVEANSIGSTEKEVETSTVVEVETSTIVAETNLVGSTEKEVETSTVIAQINSIGTTEKEIQASTVFAETNLVDSPEKQVETSTIFAETNLVNTTEKEVETSTVITEANSVSTTEKEIETSTIVVQVDSSNPLFNEAHNKNSGQYNNTITDEFIEKTTEAVTTYVSPLILTNPSTINTVTNMEINSSEPSFKIPDLEKYSTTVDETIEQSNQFPKAETINVTPTILTSNSEKTTVTLSKISEPEQNTDRTTKRLSIKDERTVFTSTISPINEFNNENVISGSTEVSIDKFSTLFDGKETSSTDLANMITINEESDAIMTETNVTEASTNIFETTNTYTVSVGSEFTNLWNKSEYSKTDSYELALFNDTDAANYSETMIVTNVIASSTERMDELRTTMEIEPVVTNFTYTEGIFADNTSGTMVSIPNEFSENVTQVSSIVSATESTSFADDALKSTMLARSLVSIADENVFNKNSESSASSVTENNVTNEIFTTTVRVNINDVDNVTETFTANNIENVTDGFVTASVDTFLKNADASNIENVTGGSTSDLERSSVVTGGPTSVFVDKMSPKVNADNINVTTERSSIILIDKFPTNIDSNSAEIVIDEFAIGSNYNTSANNSSVNNIESVSERSAPFDESRRLNITTERSSIVSIDKFPTNIDSNSTEIVIDEFAIGSNYNTSANNSSVNNIENVSERSAPFDESKRPIGQEDALTTTIRPSTSLEELLALCRGLTETITETTVSDLSNTKEYSKLFYKNSWNADKDKKGKKKDTNASLQMYNKKAILKNALLPITSVILNIVGKLEQHIRNILKKLLH